MSEEITIMLDRPRKAKMTLNVMLKFHEETGIDLQSMSGQPGAMGVKELRYLLWLCLKPAEPTTLWGKVKRLLGLDRPLTLDQVGDHVHAGNLEEITRAIQDSRDDNPKNQ